MQITLMQTNITPHPRHPRQQLPRWSFKFLCLCRNSVHAHGTLCYYTTEPAYYVLANSLLQRLATLCNVLRTCVPRPDLIYEMSSASLFFSQPEGVGGVGLYFSLMKNVSKVALEFCSRYKLVIHYKLLIRWQDDGVLIGDWLGPRTADIFSLKI